MTIPDTIIEKLQLRQTGEQIGDGSHRIFRSDIAGFDVTLMEGDFRGNPARDIVWINHAAKMRGTITAEFLQKQSIEVIKQFMQ